MPLLVIGALAGLGFLFFHNRSQPSTDSGPYSTPTQTNTPTPVPTSSKPRQVKRVVRRYHKIDLGNLNLNPRYSTQAERNYILSHTPRGQVAHMITNEGQTRVVGGHTQKMVKFWSPAGYDTRWANVN